MKKKELEVGKVYIILPKPFDLKARFLGEKDGSFWFTRVSGDNFFVTKEGTEAGFPDEKSVFGFTGYLGSIDNILELNDELDKSVLNYMLDGEGVFDISDTFIDLEGGLENEN